MIFEGWKGFAKDIVMICCFIKVEKRPAQEA
jgi:hypothetical protein